MNDFTTNLPLTRKQLNILLLALEAYEEGDGGEDNKLMAKELWEVIFEAGVELL